MTEPSFANQIATFSARAAAAKATLAGLRAKRQELAPLAVRQEKTALKKLEQLDAEAAALRREVELVTLAAEEVERQQSAAAAQAAAERRKSLEGAVSQEAGVVLDCDRRIDDLMKQLADQFGRRRRAALALQQTRLIEPHLMSRLFAKLGATRAAHNAGLASHISLEPIRPPDRRTARHH